MNKEKGNITLQIHSNTEGCNIVEEVLSAVHIK